MNEKKIPFTMNRQVMGKVKKNFGNTLVKEKTNKLKMDNINYNFKKYNSVKRKNNKSYNFSDNEKNNENHVDKIDKRKFSLINLRGISDN